MKQTIHCWGPPCRLYLEDLDAKTLLSCIAGCRNLHSLEVAKSASAALRACLSAGILVWFLTHGDMDYIEIYPFLALDPEPS